MINIVPEVPQLEKGLNTIPDPLIHNVLDTHLLLFFFQLRELCQIDVETETEFDANFKIRSIRNFLLIFLLQQCVSFSLEYFNLKLN